MATPITGIEKIRLAPIGVNGAMPTTEFVDFVDIADGSVSFSVPPVEKNRIRVEDSAGVRYVLPGDTDPPVLSAASIDIDGAMAALLSGGAWNSTTKVFSAPTTDELVYLAVEVTTKAFQGKQMVLEIPVAAVNFGFTENLTRTGFLQMSFEAEATTPVDGTGAAVPPYTFEIVTVV